MNIDQFLILGIILLLTLITLLLKNIRHIKDEAKINVQFPGTYKEQFKKDCDIETVYSFYDAQCSEICKEPGVYRSKNGACVNILTFNQTKVENKCSPKDGVLAYLIGNPQFGSTKLLCLSIDPGVQPHNHNKSNTICQGGKIEIDYLDKGFPQLSSCECPKGKILVIIPNTSMVRTRGVCVDASLEKVYKFNNLIHNPNNVYR